MYTSSSVWEVPEPVLFNAWKHHAGALRFRVAECARLGETSLTPLAESLVVIGSNLMDLYVGDLEPRGIANEILAYLKREQLLAEEVYRPWVHSRGGYGTLTLSDESEWCLRAAEDVRYVHIHPGRWVPRTCRVRANVLKTAVMVLAHVGVHGGDPLARELVNDVRKRHLNLEPLGANLETDRGLGELVTLLRGEGAGPNPEGASGETSG